ncbi:MAG: hypothetical protein LBP98_00220 [Tannerella sp.]|jgi:hypothetical protein|nr:hypothetical protein [Tannerella sp.]
MGKYLRSIKQHADLGSGGAMETGDHFKNGVKLQNLSSSGNIFNKMKK